LTATEGTDKYREMKHEDWLAFAVVDVTEVEKEIGEN